MEEGGMVNAADSEREEYGGDAAPRPHQDAAATRAAMKSESKTFS